MSDIQLNDAFFQKTAGWEVVKHARALLAIDKVLSSSYTPPVLKGVVAAGETTYRAGLVIKGVIDIDNLCTCRASRDDGIICAHSVAVGLHWMRGQAEEAAAGKSGKQESRKTGVEAVGPVRTATSGLASVPKPARDGIKLRRAEAGDVLEIHVIFPPNLADSLARGRAMLVFEGATSRGRMPLNALVKAGPFRLSPTDAELLDAAELVSGGDTPGMVQLPAADFVELLPKLAGHPRLSVGRTQPFAVSNRPAALPLKATLEANGEITIALRPGGKPPVVFSGGTAAWVLAEVGQAASLPAGNSTVLSSSAESVKFPGAGAPSPLPGGEGQGEGGRPSIQKPDLASRGSELAKPGSSDRSISSLGRGEREKLPRPDNSTGPMIRPANRAGWQPALRWPRSHWRRSSAGRSSSRCGFRGRRCRFSCRRTGPSCPRAVPWRRTSGWRTSS
jgi:hypothetical protein